MFRVFLITLVILIIIGVIYMTLTTYGNDDKNKLISDKIEVPPHMFMTKERAGLVVHYISSDNHRLISSQSKLKVWHFDRFSRASCRQTVIFFTRHDDIYRYRWLIELCKDKLMNLALVHIDPTLINELKLARNWSHSNIILATDADPNLLIQFAKLDAQHRSVVDNSLYRSVVVLCHKIPTELPSAEKTIVITDDNRYQNSSNDNVIIYKTEWTSLIDLESKDESIIVDQIVNLLME